MATVGYSQQPSPDNSNQGAAKQGDNAVDPFSMDLESLLNIKVTTASKFSEELSDAPGVMTVVSQDEIKRFGGTTLSEILDRVPGLNISSSYFTDRSMIAIDGDQTREDGGHVLFLINGRPVREVMHGGIGADILESFPVNALERIEVIQGPGSVLYGSNAFSGVINLITKKAVGESVDVKAAGGASGAAAMSGEILFDRGGLTVVAAGQYHRMPTWDSSYAFLDEALATNRVLASIRNDGEGGYLGVNYKSLSFMSSYTGFETASLVYTPGDVRWKRGFADLGYSLKAATNWEMALNLTYTRSTLDTPDFPNAHMDSNQAIAEWTNFITFSEKDKLTLGTAYDHIQGTETSTGVNPGVIVAQGGRSAISFYAQHEHKLTDDLKLIGGFQANKIGNIALNVVPRVGILWNPATHVTLKALYGGAFRAPSLVETSLNYPTLMGNPKLLPETIGTLDVQASYQGNRLQAGIGYFHSRESNLIVPSWDTWPGLYVNLGAPATFQGIDWEGKYYLRKDWFLMGSALYQFNHDPAIQMLTPIPSFSAKAGISYMANNGADLSVFDSFAVTFQGMPMGSTLGRRRLIL